MRSCAIKFDVRAPPFCLEMKKQNETEEKILREILNDSVQNRFTAYLVAAVTNKRIRYMEKKKKY